MLVLHIPEISKGASIARPRTYLSQMCTAGTGWHPMGLQRTTSLAPKAALHLIRKLGFQWTLHPRLMDDAQWDVQRRMCLRALLCTTRQHYWCLHSNFASGHQPRRLARSCPPGGERAQTSPASFEKQLCHHLTCHMRGKEGQFQRNAAATAN